MSDLRLEWFVLVVKVSEGCESRSVARTVGFHYCFLHKKTIQVPSRTPFCEPHSKTVCVSTIEVDDSEDFSDPEIAIVQNLPLPSYSSILFRMRRCIRAMDPNELHAPFASACGWLRLEGGAWSIAPIALRLCCGLWQMPMPKVLIQMIGARTFLWSYRQNPPLREGASSWSDGVLSLSLSHASGAFSVYIRF